MTGTMMQLTPFVPCTSLEAQIAFYCDILGFRVTFRSDGYAYLRRNHVGVRLVEVWKEVDLKHPERETMFYVDVKEIDALYADLKPMLETLPEDRVRAPFDQPYGQREFHVKDEDCTLILFGEAL